MNLINLSQLIGAVIGTGFIWQISLLREIRTSQQQLVKLAKESK
jgi:hypothetical protein